MDQTYSRSIHKKLLSLRILFSLYVVACTFLLMIYYNETAFYVVLVLFVITSLVKVYDVVVTGNKQFELVSYYFFGLFTIKHCFQPDKETTVSIEVKGESDNGSSYDYTDSGEVGTTLIGCLFAPALSFFFDSDQSNTIRCRIRKFRSGKRVRSKNFSLYWPEYRMIKEMASR